jgi:hypothetical protein
MMRVVEEKIKTGGEGKRRFLKASSSGRRRSRPSRDAKTANDNEENAEGKARPGIKELAHARVGLR